MIGKADQKEPLIIAGSALALFQLAFFALQGIR
jgi:hypothetical protein